MLVCLFALRSSLVSFQPVSDYMSHGPVKSPPPDWLLPSGVTRGLWDYMHHAEIAKNYDAYLSDSSLFSTDLAFVDKHCIKPGQFLDMGCGTGRLLIHLAKRDYPVLGVDLSDAMLEVAKAKAADAGVTIQCLKANLVELNALRDESFDYAACLFSTLGMVNGMDERRRVVAHAHRLLRPGGKFILHVHNRWFNFWDPAGRRWLIKDLFQSLRSDHGDREMPPHQGIGPLSLHHFTRSEAIRLLKDSGFRVLEIFPVGLRADGRVPYRLWFGWLRTYGYLLAAERG
jgi:ubiquinone/menaquinone biosynthesis C-methylase UbiE